MNDLLLEGERVDQLVSQGVQIIQSPDVFLFTRRCPFSKLCFDS